VDRCAESAGALESPLGWLPRHDDLLWDGLDLTAERFAELMRLDRGAWSSELALHQELFAKLGDRLPEEFVFKRDTLLASLQETPERWASH
jgi:phosphoenolpyruvate carboxykinase (GTP)